MGNDFKSFQRKIKNRQFAIDKSWRAPRQTGSFSGEGEQNSAEKRQWAVLNENLDEANVYKSFDGYLPLYSHRKVIGPAVVFVKRAIRKLIKIFLGWYVFPIYQRQSHFNGKIVNAVAVERDILTRLEAELAEVRTANQALGTQVSQLQEGNRRLEEELAGLHRANQWLYTLVLEGRNANQTTAEEMSALRLLVGKMENNAHDDVFYRRFEEKFRGSRDEICQRLTKYIPLIQEHIPDFSRASFVDLGSGRGEWLDILRQHGAVDCVGVDINEAQNEICRQHGHNAENRDCLEYLKALPDESVDLVSGFQLIEHLYLSDLVQLFAECRRVLRKKGLILFETPNPCNLIVGANTFYLDPSHKRPLHPQMISFYAEQSGFVDVQCIDRNSHPLSVRFPLPEQDHPQYEYVRQLNDIKWLLFGPQDYAVFAVKE